MEKCDKNKPADVKYEPSVIKNMVGTALSEIPGILGTDGNVLGSIKTAFSSDAKIKFTRGVSLKQKDNNSEVEISIKLITEYGKNIPEITKQVDEKVKKALCEMGGLTVTNLNIEVIDNLTTEEYQEKYKDKE